MTVVITAPVEPFVAADAPAVLAMYERCSPESQFRRWHGHVRAFPRSYLEALLHEPERHAAFVARRGHVVGLATAGAVTPRVYEIAILVEDAWQHRGIGRELLTRLTDEIWARGGHLLRADVFAADRGLLGPLRRIGPMTTSVSAGVITCEVLLRA